MEQNVGKKRRAVTEIKNLRKKVSEAFSNVKKIVLQFNLASLFFICLNVDPLKPRLKEFFTSDNFGLKKQQTRKLRNDKEVATKLYKKNRKQSLGNMDDPGTRRQHLFQPPGAANVSKANEKQITNCAVKLKKGASSTLDSGDLVTKENKKSTNQGKEPALSSTVVRSRFNVQTSKESKRQKVSEKYTDEEMRQIEVEYGIRHR